LHRYLIADLENRFMVNLLYLIVIFPDGKEAIAILDFFWEKFSFVVLKYLFFDPNCLLTVALTGFKRHLWECYCCELT
jgi:hypothetical protein